MSKFIKMSPKNKKQLKVKVTTGFKRGAGTDSNVYLLIENEDGRKSEKFLLDTWLSNDFERKSTDVFHVEVDEEFKNIADIHISKSSIIPNDTWYLEKIVIEDQAKEIIFPVHRWIEDDANYILKEYDCLLPQDDPREKQRSQELQKKRDIYQYEVKIEGGPVQSKILPDNERFTYDDQFELVALNAQSKIGAAAARLTTGQWKTLDDYKKIFSRSLAILEEPHSLEYWMEDYWFGLQRVQGTNANLIKLCEKIPENFGVESSMVEAHLNGSSLVECIQKKRIFIIDLKILQDIYTAENHVLCTPIALFYLNDDDNILPIAIQLFQEKGSNNPVFTPADPQFTWLLAKMYFNHAEVQYHESCTHLGFTHLVMEGVVICTHRNLSPSHPIFRLLAPHFFNLIAINELALRKILNPGGWMDKTMSIKHKGMAQLIQKSLKEWKMNVNGILPNDFSQRGVLDSSVLPNYPFRDDTVALYEAIRKYVARIVNRYYGDPEDIAKDLELKRWREELVKDVSSGGVGMQGIPGNDNGFSGIDEIIDTISAIISICSISHASANFLQYDEYAYVPNYPMSLYGDPPRDKSPLTEEDVVKHLPDKTVTSDIINITRILSFRGTNSLGNFDIHYFYHPEDVEAVEKFKKDLIEIGKKIEERNAGLKHPYEILHPKEVPNSISI